MKIITGPAAERGDSRCRPRTSCGSSTISTAAPSAARLAARRDRRGGRAAAARLPSRFLRARAILAARRAGDHARGFLVVRPLQSG